MIRKWEVIEGLKKVWEGANKSGWTFEGFVRDNYWSFRRWLRNERKRVSK